MMHHDGSFLSVRLRPAEGQAPTGATICKERAMAAHAKKLQHYVPRFYMRAWAEKEKVYCLQGGNILHPNIKNVSAGNYFYRLQELSPEDVHFLEAFIRGSPDALKASHEQLLHAFTLPYLAKRRTFARISQR